LLKSKKKVKIIPLPLPLPIPLWVFQRFFTILFIKYGKWTNFQTIFYLLKAYQNSKRNANALSWTWNGKQINFITQWIVNFM
jgi:hypothetical protein